MTPSRVQTLMTYSWFPTLSILYRSCCVKSFCYRASSQKLCTYATFANVIHNFVEFYRKFRCWLLGSYIVHQNYGRSPVHYSNLCRHCIQWLWPVSSPHFLIWPMSSSHWTISTDADIILNDSDPCRHRIWMTLTRVVTDFEWLWPVSSCIAMDEWLIDTTCFDWFGYLPKIT